jgi:competence protein ComEC
MIKWISYPYLRITTAFILGIAFSYYTEGGFEFLNFLLPLFFFLYTSLVFIIRKKIFYKFNYFLGISCLAFFFLAGHGLVSVKLNDEKVLFDLINDQPADYYEVHISEADLSKSGTFKIIGDLKKFRTNNEWISLNKKILLRYKYDSSHYHPISGDRILVKGRPKIVPSPKNPEEFDYKNYLRLEGILLQDFLNTSNFRIIANEPNFNLKYYAKAARSKVELIFNEYLKGEQEREIAKALILGDKTYLDDEVQKAYAGAGAMHVLAVSGLHVGIIFMVISLVFGWMKKLKFGNLIFAIVCIVLLVFYAFITGLSASVLRAVLMCSLIVIGNAMGRKVNIYNSIAIAAFILLLFDPYLLFSVGFQLSFFALTGIVYLQPKIYKLLAFKSNIADFLWQLTTVSIAAQMAVFPISIFYFHQFPVYFLLVNLFIIKAAAFILYGGGLLVFASFLPFLARPLGEGLTILIHFTNKLVFASQQLPHAIISNIYFTGLQVFLMYGFMVTIFYFLHKKKFFVFLTSFVLFIALFISISISKLPHLKKDHLVFFNVPQESIIGITSGSRGILLSAGYTQRNYDYQTRPFFVKNQISYNKILRKEYSSRFESKNQELLVWKNKKILFITGPLSNPLPSLDLDYLVISNDGIKDISLLGNVKFKKIIIDNTCSRRLVSHISYQAAILSYPVHDLHSQGALVEKL